MENGPLDPYEEQLLKVFSSHDADERGSLDEDGLLKLCETLQLEDRADELTKALLDDRRGARVTFPEFKDALLNLLGSMQNPDGDVYDLDASPEREVSPKFVYGSKKYGRRSRREIAVNRDQQGGGDQKSPGVQRSNSQSEVSYSKKRKTNAKQLKRCTSLTSVSDCRRDAEVACTEEMLREAWKKLGVGEDGFLNRTELIVVCDAIGLNRLADSVIRQLSNKVVLDYDKRISFQELLEALQQDETWHEFLNSSPVESDIDQSPNSATAVHGSKILQHVKLGPDGSGYITSDVILELWEHAGILSPKLLLSDLGFKGQLINIHELSTVLDREIRGMTELRVDHARDPYVALLRAFLTLYRTEIKCLRNVLEQMHDEREKLKCDVVDANNRATLLAQEVDDNVANMELNTQKHVRLLEQRHADLIKEATEQFAADKEHLAALNRSLETKIHRLETEEARLHDELDNARTYSNTIELENRELGARIAELERTKVELERQIDALEMEKLRRNEVEAERRNELMAKLGELQLENTGLRDRHDEMVSRIEALSGENLVLKGKCSTSTGENDDNGSVCEGVNLGAKRRNGSSPSDDLLALTSLGDESPRLGKVRKFHRDRLNFASNESGYDAEMDSLAYGSFDNGDVVRLQERVGLLERTLARHSIRVPNEDGEFSTATDDRVGERATKTLSVCCRRLKSVLDDVKLRLDAALSSSNSVEELKLLSEYLGELAEEDCKGEIALKLRRLEEENKELTTKCEDLENGMGMLRNEYEKCEDYWQSKLEEERRLFEHEQNHSSEKLNELLSKLSEFEEQYLKDSRLPTIVESGNLEKQFTDLEQEFEEYREDREFELNSLRERLAELSTPKNTTEIAVQVDDDRRPNLSNHVIESTNLYSADTLPFDGWNDDGPTAGPHRQKRTRQHDRVLTQHRKRNNQEVETGETAIDEPKCWIPMSLWHGLQAKKHSLELRCKKLQLVLKQQHHYDEQLLNCVRQQHWNERAELQYYVKYYHEKFDQQTRLNAEQQERLARNDSLVKDLFVDNSYLVAKNQRLEQQCHMLTHNLNANSV